jgi:hypothetical protein
LPLGIERRVAEPLRWQDVVIAPDVRNDLGDDRGQIVQDRQPSFAATLRDVRRYPNEAWPHEVLAAQTADFGIAQPGAHQ